MRKGAAARRPSKTRMTADESSFPTSAMNDKIGAGADMIVRRVLLALLLGSSANAGAVNSAASQEPTSGSESAEAVERGTPGWMVPSGSRPIVLRFEAGSADLGETIRGAIDAAAASYRRTGFAWLRFDDPPGALSRTRLDLREERVRNVLNYLGGRHRIRGVPLRRQRDQWVAAGWNEAEAGAGVALVGEARMAAMSGDDDDPIPPEPPVPEPVPEPAPIPPPPPPSQPTQPRESSPQVSPVGSPRQVAHARPRIIIGTAPTFATRVSATAAPVSEPPSVTSWLMPTGTLTLKALQALIAQCERLEGELTAECQGAVASGEGGFGAVPREARNEFMLLLDGCRTLRQGRSCAQGMAMEREFRALPRGRLDPQPLTMQEDVRTTFIARIVYDGDRTGGGRPGVPIGETRPSATGGSGQSTIVPFSGQMCFSLSADPADFLIRQIGEPCPQISEGGSRVKYDPQWEVTPLRAGTLELKLKTELFVGEEKKEFRHEPYPLKIEVKPKASPWDRIDAMLARATGTVNLATKLAVALGALFTAVAGWAIWTLFKKRRKRRKKAAADPPDA